MNQFNPANSEDAVDFIYNNPVSKSIDMMIQIDLMNACGAHADLYHEINGGNSHNDDIPF